MEIVYTPTSITITPGSPASVSFAYTRQVVDNGEVIATSDPHRGSFQDTEAGRAASYAISTNGEARTGSEILAEFGVGVS